MKDNDSPSDRAILTLCVLLGVIGGLFGYGHTETPAGACTGAAIGMSITLVMVMLKGLE